MKAPIEWAKKRVGYNTLNTGDKQVMLGCAFEQVGVAGEGVLLNDLQGDFEDYDELQVASLNAKGKVAFASYYYYTEIGGMAMEGDGWYNEDFQLVGNTMRIPVGSAFWFIPSSGAAKAVTLAGQVGAGSFPHTIKDKQSMICSAYPVAFNPNVNSTWEGFEDYDEIQVSRVNSKGKIAFTSYYYYTEVGGMAMEGDGWYDEDFQKLTEPICAVGQGFWLILGNPAGHSFVETSPLK